MNNSQTVRASPPVGMRWRPEKPRHGRQGKCFDWFGKPAVQNNSLLACLLRPLRVLRGAFISAAVLAAMVRQTIRKNSHERAQQNDVSDCPGLLPCLHKIVRGGGCCALSALIGLYAYIPRALPWAVLFGAFSAGKSPGAVARFQRQYISGTCLVLSAPVNLRGLFGPFSAGTSPGVVFCCRVLVIVGNIPGTSHLK